MTPDEAAEKAIQEFDFDDYGMDDVQPNDDAAEWVPELAKQVTTAVLAAVTSPRLLCSLCMFSERSFEDLTEDEQYERNTLTVMNGHMVCLAHQGYVGGGGHRTAISHMKENEAR